MARRRVRKRRRASDRIARGVARADPGAMAGKAAAAAKGGAKLARVQARQGEQIQSRARGGTAARAGRGAAARSRVRTAASPSPLASPPPRAPSRRRLPLPRSRHPRPALSSSVPTLAPARDAPTPVASPPRRAPAAVAFARPRPSRPRTPPSRTTTSRPPPATATPESARASGAAASEPGTIPNADDAAPTTRTTSSGGVAPTTTNLPRSSPFQVQRRSPRRRRSPPFDRRPRRSRRRSRERSLFGANDAEPTLGGGFERVPARSDSDSTSTSTSRCKPSGGWFSGRGGDYSARREGLSFRGSDGAGDEGEIAALQRVIEDMTEERLALQRGLDRQQELMQTLAEENESLTSRLNEQASETSEWREELERLRQEGRARAALTSALTEQRDVARAAAIESRERATRSSVEAIELEERMLEMRSARSGRREMYAVARTWKDNPSRFAPPPPIGTRCGRRSRRSRSERESLRRVPNGGARRAEMAEGAKAAAARRGDLATHRIPPLEDALAGRGTGSRTGAGGRSPGARRTRRCVHGGAHPALRSPSTLAREKMLRAPASRDSIFEFVVRLGTLDRGGAPTRTTTRRGVRFHFMSRSMNGVPLRVPVDKVGEDRLGSSTRSTRCCSTRRGNAPRASRRVGGVTSRDRRVGRVHETLRAKTVEGADDEVDARGRRAAEPSEPEPLLRRARGARLRGGPSTRGGTRGVGEARRTRRARQTRVSFSSSAFGGRRPRVQLETVAAREWR